MRLLHDYINLPAVGLRIPCLSGYATTENLDRIERLLTRPNRGDFLSLGHPSFEELAIKADERLFKAITSNANHVLSKYLPNLKTVGLNLRSRVHVYVLLAKD